MRRSGFLLVAFVLALVTSLALLRAGSDLGEVRASTGSTAADRDPVLRFYDAVNDVLRTGDAAPLADVVAADFVAHDAFAGTAQGRAGFAQQLLALRAVHPALQLAVEDVLLDGDRAIARLSAPGADRGAFLAIPLAGDAAAWEATDLLRLADGKVAERWGIGDPTARLQPLGSTPIEAPRTAEAGLALARFTVAPGASAIGSRDRAPVLFAVETGTLRFQGDDLALLAAATPGNGADSELARTPSNDFAASPGDRVLVPGAGGFTVQNDGPTPAVLLAVRLAPDRSHPERVLGRVHVPGDGQYQRGWPHGVSIEILADGFVDGLPPGPAAIAVGRATLAPETALALGSAAGPVLLAVEAGTLGLDTADGTARVRRGADGATDDLASASLAAGDGALIGAGTTTTIRNPGPEPLVLVLVSVAPDRP
jgi:predicted ester cyclase